MARLNMDRVEFEISAAGFEYVSGEYKNLDSILVVRCKEGHESMYSLKQLRSGRETCPICEQYSQIEEDEKEIPIPSTKKVGKRFLALDQATSLSGYAVFEDDALLHYGIKETKSPDSIERISQLRQWLVSMISQWEIDEVGLENIHYSGNPQTLITLGRLLGALEVTCLDVLGKPAVVISPGTWRRHCSIKGRSRAQQKENAQNHVKSKYGVVVSQDAADAICLGIHLSETYRFGKEVSWE